MYALLVCVCVCVGGEKWPVPFHGAALGPQFLNFGRGAETNSRTVIQKGPKPSPLWSPMWRGP